MTISRPSIHASLSGRSVLTLRHHSAESVAAVLELAADLKASVRPWPQWLAGRVIGMIFEKPSTRTRVSFETAIARLGGTAMTMSPADMQIGRGETIQDTAKVLSRFLDAIVVRSGSHERVDELSRHATVPVVNGLTPLHHPCQALADTMTLIERFGSVAGLHVTYIGDGNNCFNSLAVLAAHTGMALTCASPEGYLPDGELVAWADRAARERGGSVSAVRDPIDGVRGARAVYTDVWVSMGDEAEHDARVDALSPYQVNAELMAHAADDAIVLHPLPAHYGMEITHEMAHGASSALWDEAENRMHAQAALLVHLLPPLAAD